VRLRPRRRATEGQSTSSTEDHQSVLPTAAQHLFPGQHLPVEDGVVLNLHNESPDVSLADLFTKHGSDKDWTGPDASPWPWPPHNYALVYELLFASRRMHARTVVECGIGTDREDVLSNMSRFGAPGASLRAWRDYFPNAVIFGLDVDERVLFSEDRIRTFRVDQTDPGSIDRFLVESSIRSIDAIIDDGLHEFRAGSTLFAALFPVLSPGGIYVIEDVGDDDLVAYRKHFASAGIPASFLRLHRPDLPIGDNSMVIVQKA